MDFLYSEWNDKPAALVTYGTRGGLKAAVQMRGVLEGLHMRGLDAGLELRISESDVDDRGQLLDLDSTFAPYAEEALALGAQLVEFLEDDQSD